MTASGDLAYEVFVSDLAPIRGATMPDGGQPRWSPLSHTLVYGPTTAALVDPPITRAQTDALGDWIAVHGRTLRYIYITHWHGDHWLGAGQLLHRFPQATVLASPATAGRIRSSIAGGAAPASWSTLFGDDLADDAAAITVEEVPPEGFEIDGHTHLSIEVGHSDTDDTTILHVPRLDLVVAGDVVYNNVHQYLAEAPNGGLDAWHRALDMVASLAPASVVAGHKDVRREDAPLNIGETRRYLDEVGGLVQTQPTRQEFYAETLRRYPDRVNPYTVWLNAQRLFDE